MNITSIPAENYRSSSREESCEEDAHCRGSGSGPDAGGGVQPTLKQQATPGITRDITTCRTALSTPRSTPMATVSRRPKSRTEDERFGGFG